MKHIIEKMLEEVDYNRRKSTAGTGGKDQGQYIAYEPMTITINLNGKQNRFAFDETNIMIFNSKNLVNIIKGNIVTLTRANTNEFEKAISQKINEAKDIAKSDEGMQKLASGVSNLFGKTSEKDQLTAIKLWNANANKRVVNYEDINTEENKNAVYTYYEYMQFKRGRFDCINVKYNEGTGRIIQMDFEFTGKFN